MASSIEGARLRTVQQIAHSVPASTARWEPNRPGNLGSDRDDRREGGAGITAQGGTDTVSLFHWLG